MSSSRSPCTPGKAVALLALSLTVSLASGCTSPEDAKTATSFSATEAESHVPVRDLSRAFENDCYSLCDAIVRSVRQGNAERLAERTDREKFYDRVAESIDLDEETRRRLREGMARWNVPGPDAAFLTLADDAARGMRLEPVRLTFGEDDARILFRTRFPDGRFNYLECLVVRHDDGRAMLIDAFSLDAGGWSAELMGQALTETFGSDGSAVDLAGVASRLAQQSEAWKSGHARDSKAFDAAVEKYPPEYRESRRVILTQIRASESDPQRYARHVARLAETFPSDVALPIVSARACRLTGNYAQAFDFLDAVETQIGGDPFLDLIRAECSLGLRDFDDVRRYARKAVEADSALSGGYVALMHAEAASGEYDDAIVWAERFLECEDGTTRELALILDSDDSALRRFRASQAYRKWATVRLASP